MTTRSALRSTTAWAFGFSVTVLFIALWGRAVVVDTDALAESLAPLAGTAFVGDFVADWMADELTDAGHPPEVVEPAVGFALESSATAAALEGFVGEVVRAAASSDPSGSAVDVASLLVPTVPEVAAGLAELGIPTSEPEVDAIVSGLDPMVIRQPASTALVGPESPAAARLGTAALLALVGIIVFGYATVTSSVDRIAAVRELFSRVAVGGFGFAVLLLVGSWITDPRGGRAPVPETLSEIATSKWLVPLRVGLAAAVIAGSIYVGRRWLRRVAASRSSDEPSTQPEGQDLSLSERR